MSDKSPETNNTLPSSFREREALEKKRYKLAKKQDLIVIFLILLMALGFWIYAKFAGRGGSLAAHIYHFNEEVAVVELTQGSERTFVLDENPHMVFGLTADGGIRVVSADCPDQICVNSGVIYQAESFIACVPNGFLISIHAADTTGGEEVDIVN